MSTTFVLKHQCGRCPRVEEQVVDIDEAVRLQQTGLSTPSALRIIVDGTETVDFDELCDTCREIVDRAIGSIGRVLQHKSSTREGKKDEESEESEAEEQPADVL